MEYEGESLSGKHYIICNFDGNTGETTSNVPLTFNRVSYNDGVNFGLISASYANSFEYTFDICLDPQLYDSRIIGYSNYSEIAQWLNRKSFHKIHFFCRDEYYNDPDIYFNGSFNLSPIKYNNSMLGIRITMITDSPYGYLNTKTKTANLLRYGSFSVDYISDEIGYIVPDITIKCKSAGNILLKNNLNNSLLEIKNCVENEIITIKGNELIITSSESTHQIYNDFNFSFLKIGQTTKDRKNTIVCLGVPSEITISYNPVIKCF